MADESSKQSPNGAQEEPAAAPPARVMEPTGEGVAGLAPGATDAATKVQAPAPTANGEQAREGGAAVEQTGPAVLTDPAKGPPAPGAKTAEDSASEPLTVSDTDIRNAFELGSSLVELRRRVELIPRDVRKLMAKLPDSSSGERPPLEQVEATVSDLAWRLTTLRVAFERVSQLHAAVINDPRDVANTAYDIQEIPAYLGPPLMGPADPEPYAHRGVARYDKKKHPILAGFPIREAGRRTLNCLVTLTTDARTSLLPGAQCNLRTELWAALAAYLNGLDKAAPDYLEEVANAPTPDLKPCLDHLAAKLCGYLLAWDAYLRETLFAQDSGQESEVRLVAYEAGRALAALSWDLEVQMDDDLDAAALSKRWVAQFDTRAVTSLQRQLALLAYSLDFRHDQAGGNGSPDGSNGQDQRLAGDGELHLDLALPGSALRVVSRGLSYWYRSIQWMSKAPPNTARAEADRRRLWQELRPALIEQSRIWRSLVLGRDSLENYSTASVVQQFVGEVIASFEQVAAQRGVVAAAENVGDAVGQIARNVEQTATEVGKQASEQILATFRGLWGRAWLPILGLGAALLVAISVMVLPLVTGKGDGGQTSILAGLVAVLVAGAGGQRLQAAGQSVQQLASNVQAEIPQKVSDSAQQAGANVTAQARGLAERLGNAFGMATKQVLDALDDGMTQIQNDLRALTYSVGVAYPLVAYFVIREEFADIGDIPAFMDKVIWNETDRAAEVRRVAYAAFGSLGLFAGALATSGKPSTAPRLDWLSPARGRPLLDITLQGRGFGAEQNGSEITVNGTTLPVPIAPNKWTDTSVTLTLPAKQPDGNDWPASLTIGMRVGGQPSANTLLLVPPATLTKVTPERGTRAGLVTLDGQWFGAQQNGSEITVNGAAVPVTIDPKDWTDTRVTLTLPAKQPDGTDWPAGPLTIGMRVGGQPSANTVIFQPEP